ncbi:MBL fold metallo-hydrolase [Ruminococcus sp.]|uniref:MBL fold metallo-hydrolase n=1 Tax=Ruminococcus sp. TaxID=41978 RepID=UPI002E77FB11|nr:MBL fold metallo-hydrolase [Ruminococcus sp.]MEE1263220.1 MBL fold metallo-hydrolase [Ruminococcus sp.]
MKITALTENTAACGLPVEHGLSLFIEQDGRALLFDMGQTDLFAQNAARLGVDLAAVDIAVLSHGHYDHGGGLRRFLELNQKAPVYLSRHAFEPHFNGERYIGLDVSLRDSDRLIFTDGVTKIADGITLYSCSDREKVLDLGSFGLNMKQDGKLVPDDFRHEHYLLLEENGKRVLISGCSHRGIINIMEWFKPDVLIGGFHFNKLPLDGALRSYAETLASYDTDYYTCHCTGVEQFEYMKRFMPRLNYLSTGGRVEAAV